MCVATHPVLLATEAILLASVYVKKSNVSWKVINSTPAVQQL